MATPNPFQWVVEPLQARPDFRQRAMFGGQAIYHGELLVVVLGNKDPDWRGVLFPAERPQHASILTDYPALAPHSILPKWLFLPEAHEDFEIICEHVVQLILADDPRFGTISEKRRRALKKAQPDSDGRPPHLL